MTEPAATPSGPPPVTDFSKLWHAYGPATEVPTWLADLATGGAAARFALRELWGTVVRPDAVFSCTPAVVPYLVDLVADDAAEEAVRAEVALMLAAIGASAVPSGAPELAQRAGAAVAGQFERLLHPMARGPASVRAGLVAVCATVPSPGPRAAVVLAEVTGAADRELGDAARVALLLAGHRVTVAALEALTDTELADDREPEVRAVSFVRDRCLIAVARALPVSPGD